MKVLLICFAGMSTSLLMQKIQKAADTENDNLDIEAKPMAEVEDYSGYDIVLLAPQVRFALPDIKEAIDENTKIFPIDSFDYGLMKGEKIYKEMKELLNK